MTHSPLISIVITNYNNEEFIDHAIESVLNQSYSNIEVIVIDDCSNDNSLDIINSKYGSEHRVTLITNESNMGVSYSRNKGIKATRGRYIATLDGDDFYYSDKIKYEYNHILHTGSKVVYSYYNKVDRNSNLLKSVICDVFWDYKRMLLREGCVPRDFLIEKKLIVDNNLYFNEKLSLYEDWDWKLRVTSIIDITGIEYYGVGYRQISTGLSRKPKLNHLFTLIRIYLMKHGSISKWLKALLFFKFLSNLILFSGKR